MYEWKKKDKGKCNPLVATIDEDMEAERKALTQNRIRMGIQI
jgi:hypothetical protein